MGATTYEPYIRPTVALAHFLSCHVRNVGSGQPAAINATHAAKGRSDDHCPHHWPCFLGPGRTGRLQPASRPRAASGACAPQRLVEGGEVQVAENAAHNRVFGRVDVTRMSCRRGQPIPGVELPDDVQRRPVERLIVAIKQGEMLQDLEV